MSKVIKDRSIKIEFEGNELHHLKHFIQKYRNVLIKTENFKKPFNDAYLKICDSYNKIKNEVK